MLNSFFPHCMAWGVKIALISQAVFFDVSFSMRTSAGQRAYSGVENTRTFTIMACWAKTSRLAGHYYAPIPFKSKTGALASRPQGASISLLYGE
jgi:hypothetical protein